MIGKLREFEPEWIEQPTPLQSIAAMRQVKEAVDVPIAADQAVFTPADVYEICRQRAADVIVLSPHEAGGLLAFGKAAAIAEAAGVPVCLHGQGVSGITDAAQHHLGLRTANLTEGNQIMHQLLVEDLVSVTRPHARQGQDRAVREARPGRRARPGRGPSRGGALPARTDTTEGRRPMKALIADQKLVTELLPMDEAIERDAQGPDDARRGRRRDAPPPDDPPARRRPRPRSDAVVPRRARGGRCQGDRRVPRQLRHGVRHPSGGRPVSSTPSAACCAPSSMPPRSPRSAPPRSAAWPPTCWRVRTPATWRSSAPARRRTRTCRR